MTPLRQRFIDDLRLKNFSDGTIKVYVHAVEKIAPTLGSLPRGPVDAKAEDRARWVMRQKFGLRRNCTATRRFQSIKFAMR